MMLKIFLCHFFTKLHPFFTYEWGGEGNKIVWANLLTTMIYEGGFTIEGNSPLFGNVVTPFLGGLGAGQKFSEAIFNITRPVSLLSDPHFFARVRILPPSWQCQYFPFHVLHQLTLILFTPVGIWDGIMFGSISNCFLCFGIYPRILGEGTQID